MSILRLTRGMVTKVDNDIYSLYKEVKWQATRGGKNFYATSVFPGYPVKLHRLILGLRPGDKRCVDHINRNTLDNRRSNLRVCNKGENQFNIPKLRKGNSKFKGVRRKKNGRWEAYIQCNYKWEHIGYYVTEAEAALAYNERAKELFGEFACLNEVSG